MPGGHWPTGLEAVEGKVTHHIGYAAAFSAGLFDITIGTVGEALLVPPYSMVSGLRDCAGRRSLIAIKRKGN